MIGIAKRMVRFLAWILLPERIPAPAVDGEVASSGRGFPFWRWLLVPEPLPVDPPDGASPRPSLVRRLFKRDALPLDPPPEGGSGRSFLGVLFSREPIDGPKPKG